MTGGSEKNLIFKNVTNENISQCLHTLNEDLVSHSQNLLETKIKFKPLYTNSHFFLMQYFEKYFSFLPTFVYFNDQYVFYFVPSKRNRMINTRHSSKRTAFYRKFTKQIFLVDYDDPVQLGDLINNLFHHVPFHFLEYKITKFDTKLVSIYIYAKENHLKFALGRKGAYIKTINDMLHSTLDRRITIFIRSLGE